MILAHSPSVVRSDRQTRRRSAGFTLLELMIVVAIIGITAALAAPAIARAVAQARADRANHSLMRVIRFGRSQAMAYGRTYLLRMAASGTVTRAELWEGTTSACRLEAWNTVTASGNCSSPSFPSGNCVDYVDSSDFTSGINSVQFADGALDLCFQPNGDMLTRTTGGLGAFGYPANGAVQFTTTRLEYGTSAGDPPRGVIVPIFGAPRGLR
jgi:prepilin-type N-terminal cleavage/methylation domain-containing protein